MNYWIDEVDIILESASGDIVGIEIKSTTTPRAEDFEGLRFLQSKLGNKFLRGVLLFTGETIHNPSKDLWALPFSSLWTKHKV